MLDQHSFYTDFFFPGSIIVEQLFPDELGTFSDEVCEHWDDISDIPHLPAGSDEGSSVAVRLRQMLPTAKGRLSFKTFRLIILLSVDKIYRISTPTRELCNFL